MEKTMNTFIAKSRKTMLHYFLRIVPTNHVHAHKEADISDALLLKKLNVMLAAKSQKQVVEAVDGLGVLIDTHTFAPHKRVRTVADMKKSFIAEFEESDPKRLAHEMYLLSSKGLRANNSNSSPVSAMDAVRNDFACVLDGLGKDFSVIVEPVQDWMMLRNNLSVVASLLGRLLAAKDSRVFEQAGFKLSTDNKLGEDVYIIADKFNAPFWGLDFIEGPIRSLSTSFYTEDFLFWLLTKDHVRTTKTMKSVFCLGEDKGVYFATKPIATGKSHKILTFSEEQDRNFYLCVTNKGSQIDMAERVVLAFFQAFTGLTDTDGASFGIGSSANEVRDDTTREAEWGCQSLAARFWKMLRYREGLRLLVCQRCGDAVLTSRRGPTRQFCTDSCRVQETRNPREDENDDNGTAM